MNPNVTIIVSLLAPNNQKAVLQESKLTDSLRQYNNIIFTYMHLTDMATGTPLENWVKADTLSKSRYVTEHTSDVFEVSIPVQVSWSLPGHGYNCT